MMTDNKELTPYKGYGITKEWKIDLFGHRVKGSEKYLVDDGEDYIGEEYKTLKDAKNFIDTI